MIGGVGLSFREKVKLWRATESAKLRKMSFGKKLSYIFTYYWKWMLLFLVVLMFCGYVADVIVQAGKETVLEGFFTNDDYNFFPADKIQDEFSQRLGLGKDEKLVFDDSLYVSLDGGATEYSAASNGKIIAYMAAQELDFIVSTETVFDYYTGDVPMLDLKELLPPELYARLEPYMIEGLDVDGNPCYAGIDMTHSRYISGSENAQYAEETYVMFFPYSAPHRELLNTYIEFCFEN